MKTKIILALTTISLLYLSCEKENEEVSETLQPVSACFLSSYEGDEIWETYLEFSNCSENATLYIWDFGDSTTSTEENPTHYYSEDGVYIVRLEACNDTGCDVATDTILVNWTQVDKPNIYLYPDKNMNLSLTLNFPFGGEVIKSLPEYHDGWNVFVDISGKIDNAYDYLFYESIQPDVWQYEKGWCIKRESLKDFFETNMKEYNFNEKEIADFINYWIPLLSDYAYYNIYPQQNSQINKVIQMNFSVQPDNLFRLFYGIKGISEFKSLQEPEIKKIQRNGFTVVEWGVFRK